MSECCFTPAMIKERCSSMADRQIIAILFLLIVSQFVESGKSEKEERSGGLDMYYKYKDHFERQTETSDDVSLPFSRETYLYSRASRGYVQIIGRRVNANGARTEYARFLVESDNFGRVRFKGIQSGRYLCMNKSGKLIAKADRRNDRRKQRRGKKGQGKRRSYKVKKMRRCVFKEEYRSAYIAFRLVADESWYLAMDKTGQPRRGPRARLDRKETLFIERPIGVRRSTFGISERSKPRFNRGKNKRRKKDRSYQKSERSWPMLPKNSVISSEVVSRYIQQFDARKKSLKKAVMSLRKLKVKVETAATDEDSKLRTRKLSTYSSELNKIITQLVKEIN